jgi:hypothetical protein
MLREAESFIVPPSRNVKLTLFSCCKVLLAWCHEQLAAMVRYVWVVESAQGATLVCVDRLMGPEP